MPSLTQTVLMQRSDIQQYVGKSTNVTVGDHFQGAIRSIGTVEETIVLDTDFVDPGLLYLRNDDADNYVDIGYSTGVYPNRLYPYEQAVLPLTLTQDTVYLRADTGSVLMQYCVFERQGITPSSSPSASTSSSPSASPSASVSASPSPTPSVSPSATPSASPSAT